MIVTVTLSKWIERLTAAESGDERLRVLIGYDDFYDRIAGIGYGKHHHLLTDEELATGPEIARLACLGLKHRDIPTRLINNFYLAFYNVKKWLKNSSPIKDFTFDFKTPKNWIELEPLLYSAPDSDYHLPIIKLLRHNFERYQMVNDKRIFLPIEVSFS